MESILVQALAATTFAKILVDIFKLSPIPTPGRFLPYLAIICGEIASFLFFLTSATPFTRQTVAITLLAGIIAGGGAVGVTELHKKANSEP